MDGTLDNHPTTLVVALYGQPISVLAASSTQQTNPGNNSVTEAATGQTVSLWTRLVLAASSFTPVALVTLLLLTLASLVAGFAHLYRNKLPKPLRQSWYRHHGLYKMVGLLSLLVVVISLYSGGQI